MNLTKLLYFVAGGAVLGLVAYFLMQPKVDRDEILRKAREVKEKRNDQATGN